MFQYFIQNFIYFSIKKGYNYKGYRVGLSWIAE